jgi:hypothetical protein
LNLKREMIMNAAGAFISLRDNTPCKYSIKSNREST